MRTPIEQLKREALAGLESLGATLAKLVSEPLAPDEPIDGKADDEADELERDAA